MKYVIFFIFSFSIQGKEIVILQDFNSLKWGNRIILVNTVNNKDSIMKTFEQNEDNINERDIVWFVIQDDTLATNFNGNLTDDFLSNTVKKYKSSQGKITLIGKDGGIKSSRESLDLEAIFLEIDAMPMRQIEMQSQ
ncbi:DUF4174 domain-containing protein [Psychromonas sp.]|uniref:DUF4174 domain-containing protein n=1 Tax=Psychromonas sp. TaxID=1884585 RepID=UPI0039E59A53